MLKSIRSLVTAAASGATAAASQAVVGTWGKVLTPFWQGAVSGSAAGLARHTVRAVTTETAPEGGEPLLPVNHGAHACNGFSQLLATAFTAAVAEVYVADAIEDPTLWQQLLTQFGVNVLMSAFMDYGWNKIICIGRATVVADELVREGESGGGSVPPVFPGERHGRFHDNDFEGKICCR